jgi:hypothetical protein
LKKLYPAGLGGYLYFLLFWREVRYNATAAMIALMMSTEAAAIFAEDEVQ